MAPSGNEQISDLCHGIAVTAERLRHAVPAFARQARWSSAAASASWRKDALASAITGHASELILRGFTERARQLAADPAICVQLQTAADASSQAWLVWRAIAHHFDIASTGIHRSTGPTPVAAEFGDLVLRIGRLAYRNQHWTPARAHASQIRNPADLAPAPADITSVVAAVHTAADAITRIAAGDREAVRAAAADHRLYVPAFTRTNAAVVRRRYRPAPPSRIDEILASYDDAIEASTRVTSKLDDLGLALDAPTWPLAALRAQSQRIPRTFRPGGTSAPHRSANSPARQGIGARVRVWLQAVAGICLLVLIRRVETADWSRSTAGAQCRHARIPASLRPRCVRGRTWQQNLRRARIGMIGAAASARSSSRNEYFI